MWGQATPEDVEQLKCECEVVAVEFEKFLTSDAGKKAVELLKRVRERISLCSVFHGELTYTDWLGGTGLQRTSSRWDMCEGDEGARSVREIVWDSRENLQGFMANILNSLRMIKKKGERVKAAKRKVTEK